MASQTIDSVIGINPLTLTIGARISGTADKPRWSDL